MQRGSSLWLPMGQAAAQEWGQLWGRCGATMGQGWGRVWCQRRAGYGAVCVPCMSQAMEQGPALCPAPPAHCMLPAAAPALSSRRETEAQDLPMAGADPPRCNPTAPGAPCNMGEGEECLAQHSPPSLCSPTAPVSPPQIDQDGLTLPERTLYLGQDEESEKVREGHIDAMGTPGEGPAPSMGWQTEGTPLPAVPGAGVPVGQCGVALSIPSIGTDPGCVPAVHGAAAHPPGGRACGAEGPGDSAAGAAPRQCEGDAHSGLWGAPAQPLGTPVADLWGPPCLVLRDPIPIPWGLSTPSPWGPSCLALGDPSLLRTLWQILRDPSPNILRTPSPWDNHSSPQGPPCPVLLNPLQALKNSMPSSWGPQS